MTTLVRRTNGNTLLEIPDQTINVTQTSLALLGKGANGYGQAVAENFVHLLENFANSSSPTKPLVGQIWYDTSSSTVRVFNGTVWNTITGGVTSVGANAGNGIQVVGGPITTSGAITISLANTAVTPGTYTNATVSVDATGRIIAASSGSGPTSTTPTLPSTGVVPGTYTYATLTVDATGRLTAASSGIAPSTGGSGTLSNTGVTPGTYQSPVISVDATGRITNASNGATQAGSVGYIPTDTTLSVPLQYPTIRAAMAFLAGKVIPKTAMITIQVASGYTEIVNSTTGVLDLSHPHGDRIQILGSTLSGSLPTVTDVENAGKSTVETLLRNRFSSIISISGSANLVTLVGTPLALIRNILFITDGSAQNGFSLGSSNNNYPASGTVGGIGGATATLENCWFHGFSFWAVGSEVTSCLSLSNVGATYNGSFGIHGYASSTVILRGAIVACNNGVAGVGTGGGCFISLSNASCFFHSNGNSGILLFESTIAVPSTGSTISAKNNTNVGVAVTMFSGADLYGLSVSGNGTYSVYAASGSYASVRNSTVTGTYSPALNTGGNNNSFIGQA